MVIAAMLVTFVMSGAGQQPVPQPFPRPGSPQRPTQPPPPAAPAPAEPAPSKPEPAPARPPQATPAKPQQTTPTAPPQTTAGATQSVAPGEEAPSQATLGLPVYPAATFLRSFDAGQGQRYYLFGTNASFVEIVAYYRTYLKNRGNELFESDPPVHVFEVGRFREETMAYAPGITIKDYTWGGSEGYLHVRPGQAAQRYRTIIQIVPAPPGSPR